MGWLTDFSSRKELIRHLTQTESQINKETLEEHKLVTHKQVFKGNNMWTIQEWFVNDKPQGKFIVLYMMVNHGKGGWGYKGVEETCGPTYYNCPVSWFDEVHTTNETATEWRKEVRKLANSISRIKHGQTIQFSYDMKFTDGVSENTFLVFKQGRQMYFRRKSDHCEVNIKKIWLSGATILAA
jgi:hypothetical protein